MTRTSESSSKEKSVDVRDKLKFTQTADKPPNKSLHLTWLIGDDFNCSKPEKVMNGDGHTPDPPSR